MLFDPEPVARDCHEAVRRLRAGPDGALGPSFDELDDEKRGWYVRHVERARDGQLQRTIHELWRADMAASGWKPPGEAAPGERSHPALVPWELLPESARNVYLVVQMRTTAAVLGIPPLLAV